MYFFFGFVLFLFCCIHLVCCVIGSSNGHSPVLNLSKSGGLDQGSTGDQSDHSVAHSPPPSIHDEEDNLSDDNVSDVDEREEKEDGKLFKEKSFLCVFCHNSYLFLLFILNSIEYEIDYAHFCTQSASAHTHTNNPNKHKTNTMRTMFLHSIH